LLLSFSLSCFSAKKGRWKTVPRTARKELSDTLAINTSGKVERRSAGAISVIPRAMKRPAARKRPVWEIAVAGNCDQAVEIRWTANSKSSHTHRFDRSPAGRRFPGRRWMTTTRTSTSAMSQGRLMVMGPSILRKPPKGIRNTTR
jgi:hypothetical protein